MRPVHEKHKAVDLDTAISMTGVGKFHLRVMMVVAGCRAAGTTDNLSVSFVLSALECEWGLSVTEKGLLSGATFLGMILCTYGWGVASDTFGRRRILILSLGLTWVTSFCGSLAPVFWLLVLLRFLSGAASSGMLTTFYAYLGEFLPPEQRTKYLAWCSICNGLVFWLMPASAWLILPLTWSLDLGFIVIRSWRILSLLNGCYTVATFLGILGLPETPKYLVSVDKHNEAIDVLKKVFSINTGRPRDDYPVHAIRNTAEDIRTVKIEETDKMSALNILKMMKNQVAPIFGRKHLYTTIVACVYSFCIFSSALGFFFWVPVILDKMLNYYTRNPNATVTMCDAINIRLATASNVTCQSEFNPMVYMGSFAMGVNYCLGFLLVGFLVKFMGKRTLLAALQLVSGIAGLGLYWATSPIAVTVFSTVYMAQAGINISLLNSVLLNLYPTHLRNTALSIVTSAGGLGSFLTGTIIGAFLENNCTATIFGLSAMSIGTVLLSFLIPRPKKMIEPIT